MSVDTGEPRFLSGTNIIVTYPSDSPISHEEQPVSISRCIALRCMTLQRRSLGVGNKVCVVQDYSRRLGGRYAGEHISPPAQGPFGGGYCAPCSQAIALRSPIHDSMSLVLSGLSPSRWGFWPLHCLHIIRHLAPCVVVIRSRSEANHSYHQRH